MSGAVPIDAGGILLSVRRAQRAAAWSLMHVRSGRLDFVPPLLIELQRALHHAEQLAAPHGGEEEDTGERSPAGKRRKTQKKSAAD